MTFLQHLKRANLDDSIRWIVKTTSEGKIREIKQIYNPEDYKNRNRKKRILLNKQELIKLIEKDKTK